MIEVKATTAFILGKFEYRLSQMHDQHTLGSTILVNSDELYRVVKAYRELEADLKKKHAKPSYSEIGKPRYYCAE